jgi:hypothetical protein
MSHTGSWPRNPQEHGQPREALGDTLPDNVGGTGAPVSMEELRQLLAIARSLTSLLIELYGWAARAGRQFAPPESLPNGEDLPDDLRATPCLEPAR